MAPVETAIPPQRSVVSRVLIVDDSPDVLDLRNYLKARGYEIHLARDAGQARSLVATRRPDFVFTETLLPQETGFELCSFLKRQNVALPVVMLTEIDLDAGRNLAMWCGADGYVTKPFDYPYLDRLISGVADAVWLRNHTSLGATQGRIDFQCGCGKRLSVRQENAGKAIRCPKCAQLVVTPKFSTVQTGTWKRSQGGDDGDDQRRSNLFCQRCGQMVLLLEHSRTEKSNCLNCGQEHTIPRWLLDQRRFFFQPPVPDAMRDHGIRRRLRRFLTLTCQSCRERFPLDPERPETACRCPQCGTVEENPSLRNSPLAKAALASTGRLFAVAAGRTKNRKFLLPEQREILIGSDEACSLRFVERNVAPYHAALAWHEDGPHLRPITMEQETMVNGEVIIAEAVLEPGDLIQLGSVRLLLMGHRQLDLSDDDGRTQQSEEESITIRDARIARQAATVLQLYWEHQRKWLKAHPEFQLIDDGDETSLPTEPQTFQQPWSGASSSHVLLQEHDSQPLDTRLGQSSDSAIVRRDPVAPPQLRLPDPTSCGPAEPAPAPEPETPLSIREQRRLQDDRPADQAAAHIISGIFQRPPRK